MSVCRFTDFFWLYCVTAAGHFDLSGSWTSRNKFFASIFALFPRNAWYSGYKLHISKYKFMHAYRPAFALGGISIPCSLFTSHFSLAFKGEPRVTRVLNCLSVLVVITDFKAMIYITRGSTVSFNLNRKKNLNNRKTRVNEWFISLSPNFMIN